MTREEFRDYVDVLRSQNEISYNVYSELIDGIDTLEQEPCDYYDTYNKTCRRSEVPKEPKWISVSERLPKAGECVGDVDKYYLVQNEYGDMMVARYTHSEYWEQIFQVNPIGDEIVAWMPLPELYKAELRGEE